MPVKSKVEISQNFAAFSEYMNFTTTDWETFYFTWFQSAFCQNKNKPLETIGLNLVEHYVCEKFVYSEKAIFYDITISHVKDN